MTTIGRERRSNPLLGLADETAFRAALLDGLGPYPTYYAEMGPINRAGPAVVGRLALPPELGPDAVRSAPSPAGRTSSMPDHARRSRPGTSGAR